MIGRMVGHYRIVAKLGEGGMGQVYRAEDLRLHRDVALKVLAPSLAAERTSVQRFHQEARSAAALNHPNVVTIHSVEEVDGLPFLTMELVEGVPLNQLIPPGEGLPVARCLEVGAALCAGLAAAHDQGLIHRDLKPENVMVTAEGRVKILDFGIAKVLADSQDTVVATVPGDREERREKVPASMQLTEPGRVLGTAAYMSPEQIQGRPLDPRSDLFSLGVLLYEMATGRRPFEGATANERMLAVLRDRPLSPSTLRRDLPARLEEIILRCLEKAPQDRYASTSELMADLQTLFPATGDPLSPPLPSRSATLPFERPPRRSIRQLWTAAAVLPVVIAAATILPGSLQQHPGGAPRRPGSAPPSPCSLSTTCPTLRSISSTA